MPFLFWLSALIFQGNAEDHEQVVSSDLTTCLLEYGVFEGQSSYLLFVLKSQYKVPQEVKERNILLSFKKPLAQSVWEIFKGTMTSYWKSTHSTHYQKTNRCRSQGNWLALFHFSKSLKQNAVQGKETTAKNRNKRNSGKTNL